MEFTEEKQGKVLVIKLSGDLKNEKNRTAFYHRFNQALEEYGDKIVINLKGVGVCNSIGAGTLITAYTSYNTKFSLSHLYLSEVPENIEKLLKITGLIKFFAIFKTNEQAVQIKNM